MTVDRLGLAVLTVNLGATLFMTGLIWFVQIVHYPLFGAVGASVFPAYEAAHTRLTTYVVAPMMLLELATALGLVGTFPSRPLLWLAAALIAVLWVSTGFVQVPLHGRLERSFDPAAHAQLVRTNWIRTVAWSLRSLILIWSLWAALPENSR